MRVFRYGDLVVESSLRSDPMRNSYQGLPNIPQETMAQIDRQTDRQTERGKKIIRVIVDINPATGCAITIR
jgi:hypothetical protein